MKRSTFRRPPITLLGVLQNASVRGLIVAVTICLFITAGLLIARFVGAS